MKCKCGSTNLHRYFHYVREKIERFRCLDCSKCYEVRQNAVSEIQTVDVDANAFERFRKEFGL